MPISLWSTSQHQEPLKINGSPRALAGHLLTAWRSKAGRSRQSSAVVWWCKTIISWGLRKERPCFSAILKANQKNLKTKNPATDALRTQSCTMISSSTHQGSVFLRDNANKILSSMQLFWICFLENQWERQTLWTVFKQWNTRLGSRNGVFPWKRKNTSEEVFFQNQAVGPS